MSEKFFVMPMFPYPSGSGLHVGHASNFMINDVVARFKRMLGYDVIHPFGYDSFGLPTENYAIKQGKPANLVTDENIAYYNNQISGLDLSFDTDRMLVTSSPEYYKWTQWIFSKLYQHNLVYRKDGFVNWCPGCQTVLANDQVVDGKCERCESEITQKKQPQRYIKITDYADQLLDYSDCNRPEETKIHQTNWIGRSEGAEIEFTTPRPPYQEEVSGSNSVKITVFTTRPDTVYGVTAIVLAPEIEIIDSLMSDTKKQELSDYRKVTALKTAIDRQHTEKEKTGFNSGVIVIHPLTGEQVPVWFADYVLPDYATGAVMFVPAHDERDWDFARKYGIDIKPVLWKGGMELSENGHGLEILTKIAQEKATCTDKSEMSAYQLIGSAQFTNLDAETAKKEITKHLELIGKGKSKVTYRLRDWSISRQRYWGSPIPFYYTFAENEKVPYFEYNDPIWGFKEGETVKTRNIIQCIIKDVSSERYLMLKWKVDGSYGFVGGGVEQNEDITQAAVREIEEETGYANAKFVKEIGVFHNKFFHPLKLHNQYSMGTVLYFEVDANNIETISQEELGKHEPEWLTEEQVFELGKADPINIFFMNLLLGNSQIYQPTIDRYNAYNPHPNKDLWIPHPIPDEELPVVLPLDLGNYKPAGKSPLEDHHDFRYYKPTPHFIQKSGPTTVRQDVETVARNGVYCIVKNIVANSYLGITFASTGDIIPCISGGIDDDEDIISAAIREISEETGIDKLNFVRYLGKMKSIFYSPHKGCNSDMRFDILYFETEQTEFGITSLDEQSIQTPVWIKSSELQNYTTREDIYYVYNLLDGKVDQNTVYLRECDTLDTFMCSSFYFLRYLDATNPNQLFDPRYNDLLPVDMYIGGKEHTVGHLLYSRFIYKFLKDIGVITNPSKEPFKRLIHQGMVLASDGRKMSKRWGNVIDPNTVIDEFNTDTLRVYLMFMGPLEQTKNRNPNAVAGVARFIERVRRVSDKVVDQGGDNLDSIVHQTIKGVREDYESLKFNTAVSKLMVLTNAMTEAKSVNKSDYLILLQLLAPMATTVTQEMYEKIGYADSIHTTHLPDFDPALCVNNSINLPVQINGKMRGTIEVAPGITQEEVLELVRQIPALAKYVEGEIKKVIFVQDKICNIII